MAVQWLGICASTVGDTCSIPDWGTRIPHDVRPNFFFKKCINMAVPLKTPFPKI